MGREAEEHLNNGSLISEQPESDSRVGANDAMEHGVKS